MNIAQKSQRLPLVSAKRRQFPLADHARPVDLQARPKLAVWELTLRCDLSCRHCSSRAGHARPDELSTEEALALVGSLAKLGVLEVTLIGGEAYLRDDWLQIIKAIRAHGMQCTMVTAGRGIDQSRAEAAQLAGLQSVSVSIDGSPDVHDSLRNLKGSHQAALRAMHYLAKAGIQVSANSQIGRHSYRDLPKIFDTIASAGAHSWQIQLTVPGGRAADDPSLLLEPYQVLEVFSVIAWLKPQADAADILIWPGNNLGYFGPYEHLLRGNLFGGHRGSCGAGCVSIGIESNGDIKGCPSLPSDPYTGGNIREFDLVDIWQRAEPLRFARNMRVSELWGYCAECYYAEHCLAGCSWTAHSLFGKRGNNPLCHHRALEMLKRGRRERLVQVKAPSGTPFDHGLFEIVEEDWPAAELKAAQAVAGAQQLWLET